MKLKREQKEALVDGLRDELRGATTVYLADFTGLAVKQQTELRRRLRSAGARYFVVKNTLAQRALQAAAVEGLDTFLVGPTAVAIASDPIAGAKVLTEFAREVETFSVKAALVEGRPVGPAEVKRLATLPSRDQLLAELSGVLQAPMSGFAGALNGLLMNMVGALEALREQRGTAA